MRLTTRSPVAYPVGFWMAFKCQPRAAISSSIRKMLNSFESNATTLTCGSDISLISFIFLSLENSDRQFFFSLSTPSGIFWLLSLLLRDVSGCFNDFLGNLDVAVLADHHQSGPCHGNQAASSGTGKCRRDVDTAWPVDLGEILKLSVFRVTIGDDRRTLWRVTVLEKRTNEHPFRPWTAWLSNLGWFHYFVSVAADRCNTWASIVIERQLIAGLLHESDQETSQTRVNV